MASGIEILLAPAERPALVRYGVPTLVLLLVSYSRAPVPWLSAQAPFALLLPATFVAAWFGGLRVGIPVAIGCAWIGMPTACSAAFWRNHADASQLLLFLTNAAIVLGLCTGLHRLLQRSRTARDEAARHFEIMANNAPVLIWCTDPEGGCVFVNRNWIRFTGRTSAPHHRRPGQLHPADSARYQAVASEAMAARKPYHIEYRLRRADDSYRWLNEHAVPRFGQNGRFEGYIGSCSDVTDARSEREELAFVARLQTTLTESLDLDKCADALAGAFVPRLADWCSIQLVNDGGELEQVRMFRIHGGGGLTAAPSDFAATGRTGVESRIVAQGELVFVEHVDESLLRALAIDETHFKQLQSQGGAAYLGVPLRARGQIIGVLALATLGADRALGPAENRLVQKIAGVAGLALDNARLYRSARRALAAEKHALREVDQMEQRFRFLWEANLFGMGTVAPSGRILSANATLCQLLGYSPETVAAGAASINERTAVGWHAADLRSGAELLRTGRCTPYEKEYMRPDGTKVQVMLCGMVLPQSDECLTFLLDLTPQKHAERALLRQSMLLETIIEAMPAMIGYLGRDGRFLLHNEKCRQWLGAPKSVVDSRTIRDLLDAPSYERMAPYLQAAFRGRNMRHEYSLSSNHRERHLIASYHPDRDADGKVCGVVLHAYDITERKETEQALAEALERYRFLADAMPQMVWTATPDGRLDYVNHRWLETTGMTEAASLSVDGWQDAVHFEDRAAVRSAWSQAVENATPFEQECRLRCGKAVTWRWHLIRALPRRDDQLRLVQWVGSATDIDELRLAYAELKQAREKLESHADELETRVRARTATLRETNAELEAFTYSVSHDLRTPLQFVRGFAEAIHTDPHASLSAENRDYLERIIRSAGRMDTIIQDLLAYSRLTRSEMQLVELPLEDIVSDVLANHQSAIRQSGAAVVVERPLPRVCADSTGLFQAVSNLVANALKFHQPNQPPSIRFRSEQTDHGTRLWVEDDGIGIDPQHHERIFKLFERLHSNAQYPGTGIGLSLVRKAVQRMGGACGVESSPGAGSRFWIDFPVPCPLVSPAEPAAHSEDNRTDGARLQVHQVFTEGD